MFILVVDGNYNTRRAIENMLGEEGHRTVAVDAGEPALAVATDYDFDLMLTELKLPDISGYKVLSRLRSAKSALPVVVVSGMATIDDKVKAFEQGADDYLVKPFQKAELIARIQAVGRRARGHAASAITIGNLMIDLTEKMASIDGKTVKVTPKEFQVLELLALRKGKVLTTEMFLNHLYGGRDEPGTRVICMYIFKLRKRLAEASGGMSYIQSVWGRGYLLRAPDSCPPVAVGRTVGAKKQPDGSVCDFEPDIAV